MVVVLWGTRGDGLTCQAEGGQSSSSCELHFDECIKCRENEWQEVCVFLRQFNECMEIRVFLDKKNEQGQVDRPDEPPARNDSIIYLRVKRMEEQMRSYGKGSVLNPRQSAARAGLGLALTRYHRKAPGQMRLRVAHLRSS